MRKKTFLTIISLLFSEIIFSQNPEWMVFDTSNSPLHSNNYDCVIYDLEIDAWNNKWIGSSYCSVLKFDDINWYSFPIGSIFVEINKNNDIWAGGYLYNGVDFTWMLIISSVSAFEIDDSNYLWIGFFPEYNECNYGIYKYNTQTDQIEKNYKTSNSGLTDNCVWEIHPDKKGNVWIYTMTGDLFRFDRGNNWFLLDSTTTPLPNYCRPYELASDSDTVTWLATRFGLIGYDEGAWEIYDIANSCIPSRDVYSVAIDSGGVFWLGTDSGLVKFDKVNCTVFNTSNSPLPYNLIQNIRIDHFGNKWMISGQTVLAVYREGGVILNSNQNFLENRKWVYVYPNPSSTELKVTTGVLDGMENKIELYDLQGRIMLSNITKESETIMDISQLPAGVYYCVVSSEKYRETVKVVKL